MNVNGKKYRTIWLEDDNARSVFIIDQRHLIHQFVIKELSSSQSVYDAIHDMHVRGAGLIEATLGVGRRQGYTHRHLVMRYYRFQAAQPQTALNMYR